METSNENSKRARMDSGELLWRMYEDHRLAVRHSDQQRSKITDCMLVLAAAAVGLIKFGGTSEEINIILAAFVVMIGIFGIILTDQHTNACNEQKDCVNKYKEALKALHPKVIISPDLKEQARFKNPWFWIHVGILLLGLALLTLTIAGVL